MPRHDSISIPWPDWQVVSELGEGGYGKVYEIERTLSGLTDRAALKVIRIPKNRGEYEEVAFSLRTEEGARTYFVEQKDRLVNEIGIMKELKATSNIVSIEDWYVKELNDGFSWEIYIRMELLTPLKKKIRKQGDLNEQEIIKLGKDICNGLILCEKNNIVHRDIKPDNILLAEHGSYKLGDFGIARNLDNETTMTSTFSMPYVSPEVYNREKAGKTIDTYSLGLVMYELLNNRRVPFLNAEGHYTGWEKEQAIHRRLSGEKLPEPLHGSPELKRIVLKACSYDSSDRYRTATEFRNALEEIDKSYTLNRKDEEFHNPLDEEYDRTMIGTDILESDSDEILEWYEDFETVGLRHEQDNKQRELTLKTRGLALLQTKETKTMESNLRQVEGEKKFKKKKTSFRSSLTAEEFETLEESFKKRWEDLSQIRK